MKTPESYLYQNQEKMLFVLASEGKRKKITKRDKANDIFQSPFSEFSILLII